MWNEFDAAQTEAAVGAAAVLHRAETSSHPSESIQNSNDMLVITKPRQWIKRTKPVKVIVFRSRSASLTRSFKLLCETERSLFGTLQQDFPKSNSSVAPLLKLEAHKRQIMKESKATRQQGILCLCAALKFVLLNSAYCPLHSSGLCLFWHRCRMHPAARRNSYGGITDV